MMSVLVFILWLSLNTSMGPRDSHYIGLLSTTSKPSVNKEIGLGLEVVERRLMDLVPAPAVRLDFYLMEEM